MSRIIATAVPSSFLLFLATAFPAVRALSVFHCQGRHACDAEDYHYDYPCRGNFEKCHSRDGCCSYCISPPFQFPGLCHPYARHEDERDRNWTHALKEFPDIDIVLEICEHHRNHQNDEK